MQKQKQKRQKLGKQEQQIKKRTQSQKRQVKAAELDNAVVAAVAANPASVKAPLVKKATTTTASQDNNKNKNNNKGSRHKVAANMASGQQSNKKNKVLSSPSAKKSQRAKLISAYEAIVFSESQIPVFLSQDHQRQRRSQESKGDSKRKSKRQVDSTSSLSSSSDQPAPLSSWETVDPKIHEVGGMNSIPQAKEDNARDLDKTGMQLKHNSGMNSGVNLEDPVRSNNNNNNEEIAPTSVSLDALDDKNRIPNDRTMQGVELAQEHDPDLQHSTAHDNTWAHFHRNSSFVYHGCVSSPAVLFGLVTLVLLVLYKVYTRRQRDAMLSSTPSPLVPGSTLFPADSKSTGFERTTITRQLHMHPASTPQ